MKGYILRLSVAYLRSKQANRFISFITLTSILGIGLGVMVLITILSVMNGFQHELRERILGMVTHITISETDDRVRDWQDVREAVLAAPSVVAASPIIEGQGLAVSGKDVHGVMVRGVLPDLEVDVSKVNTYANDALAELAPGTFNAIVGVSLAAQLRVFPGDTISIIIPQMNTGLLAGLPRIKRFTVVGLLDSGTHEYDSAMVITHLADAAALYRTGEDVHAVQLLTDDLFGVQATLRELGDVLESGRYFARTWQQQHQNFFQAIQLEKRMMFIILGLIILVATFNIVSTMVMVVHEKHAAIAILRTQGARRLDVMSLFLAQGMIIGSIGTVGGVVFGLATAFNLDIIVPWLEQVFGMEFFPADVYYISEVPSKVAASDVVLVATLSFLGTVIAALYPAWKAANIQPADVLRYE